MIVDRHVAAATAFATDAADRKLTATVSASPVSVEPPPAAPPPPPID